MLASQRIILKNSSNKNPTVWNFFKKYVGWANPMADAHVTSRAPHTLTLLLHLQLIMNRAASNRAMLKSSTSSSTGAKGNSKDSPKQLTLQQKRPLQYHTNIHILTHTIANEAADQNVSIEGILCTHTRGVDQEAPGVSNTCSTLLQALA